METGDSQELQLTCGTPFQKNCKKKEENLVGFKKLLKTQLFNLKFLV